MEQVLNIFAIIFVVAGMVYFYRLFYSYKEKIILKLNNKYYTQEEFMNAVIEELKKQGKNCIKIDKHNLIINKKKYRLMDKNSHDLGVSEKVAMLKKIG